MRQIVNVTYDGINTLTLDPPSVQLAPGDWVEWQFSNVPPGCIPWIRFDDPHGYGPLQCLQLVPDKNTVQGKGNLGTSASYAYTAWLLTYSDVPPISGSGTVVNPQQAPNTSPEVLVHYKEGALNVKPEDLTLSPGDLAIWNVHGLPEDHFVIIRFDLTPGDTSHPALFESLLSGRPVNHSDVVQICGVSFNPPSYELEYTYRIEVRDSSGRVVASHDPRIDNLGEPPLGAGG